MSPRKFDPHLCSNTLQFGFLATRPGLYAQSWSCQYISVELRMFLLSARRAELEVRHDDDNCSPLFIDQRSLRVFCVIFFFVYWLSLVRTSLNSTELRFFQVGPALKWIFGFHDLFQTILVCHLRSGISNVHNSLALPLPLH